jgi:hypothetical protein
MAKGGGMGRRGREKSVKKFKVEYITKRRALQGGSQKWAFDLRSNKM